MEIALLGHRTSFPTGFYFPYLSPLTCQEYVTLLKIFSVLFFSNIFDLSYSNSSHLANHCFRLSFSIGLPIQVGRLRHPEQLLSETFSFRLTQNLPKIPAMTWNGDKITSCLEYLIPLHHQVGGWTVPTSNTCSWAHAPGSVYCSHGCPCSWWPLTLHWPLTSHQLVPAAVMTPQPGSWTSGASTRDTPLVLCSTWSATVWGSQAADVFSHTHSPSQRPHFSGDPPLALGVSISVCGKS